MQVLEHYHVFLFQKELNMINDFENNNGLNHQLFFAKIQFREIYLAVNLIIKMNSERNLVVKLRGFLVRYFVHV